MNAEQLKNSILQRAVEGTLVEQREEEGTAAELLREIKAEKARLVKEGKLKKEKPLRSITAEEIPFEIPKSWEWVRFSDLFDIARGGSPRPIKQFLTTNANGINWIKISDTEIGGKYIRKTKEKIILEGLKKSRLVQEGDLLLTNSMSYGRPYIMQTKGAIHDGWLVLSPYVSTLNKDFFYYLMSCPYIKNEFANTVAGAVVKNLNKDKVKELFIPLPPLAEQKRIVAKIEELLPHVEQYGKAHDELTALNEKFPDAMKKSVLHYAMEGKLVEQREEEGTAKELLAAIKAEKARLVVEGKLKKEKPLRSITAEEIPFEIPESWEWVRLGEIITKITDGTHHSPPNKESGEFMYITAKNIKDYGIDLSQITYVSKEIHNEIYSRCNPEKGDILLIKDGATTGVVTVNSLEEPFSLLSSVALLKTSNNIDAWYIVYILRSQLFYETLRKQMKGTGITRITLKQITPFLVPLPPLAEQKRIVAKIEELLACCGALGNESTA